MMKEKEKRLSNAVKPEGMDAAEWQRALRRQFAAREVLSISPNGEEAAYGVFDVRNPKSKNWYKVVYRGADSRWNYCSCMDYKTNQLGTCKHIEAVRLWLENHGRKIQAVNPPYSSLYVSYRDGRKIFLRIGSAHWDEMGTLAKKYFTKDLELIENTIPSIQKFISEAKVIDPDFKCYPDVLDYLAEKKDAEYREQYLSKVTDEDMAGLLKARLYPYQAEGIRFAFAKGKSIIADEMGLGKTIQAIGTAELMRKAGLVSSVLILCPASLKYQWLEEINKFTDSDAVVVEGLPMKRKELYESGTFYKIVSYNAMSNDVKMFGKMSTELLIMDEVQRLKNWNTQISKAARHIQSDYAVVLSGTPLENKLEELYSVMEFVDQYCLGPYYKFIEETTVKVEIGEESGQAYPGEKGAKNALEIELLKSNLILKADKTEIPNPEIYYVDNFNEEPSISGLYITEKEARFWNGSEWCNITINTVSSLSGEVNDNYVPTAKAVVNALSYLNNEMDKYATDEEVNSTVEIKVQEAIHEKLDNEDFSSLLNSINNFKNSI